MNMDIALQYVNIWTRTCKCSRKIGHITWSICRWRWK